MKLTTYISQHNNDTAPVIILLCLAKLKIWGGQPQVGNCLFGSRLHINDDMPQILEFKSNLNALDTNVESSSRTSHIIIKPTLGKRPFFTPHIKSQQG
ncbi:unnamed protein product [Lactuca saligna]|uniref:Uncharacterized protein n=1 Tax=Lactuca saligna TaxID=75948 RepID=A0AA36E8A4_LACSI|nr:unnamed protein product [Lactuca saligna]